MIPGGVSPFAFLLLGAQSATDKMMDALFDDTFAGIHQLDWFDYTMLVPYFAVLIVLSLYGLHRYEMIRAYYKNKHKLPKEAPSRFDELPRVTVQLPLYNERFVVDRLVDEICKIDYPKDKLQIQILDDSTDETHAYAERLVAEYRAAGYPIEYRHRTNRHGFKAGALQEGMEDATGEFIAIFDADFVPPVDFLQKTIHFFKESKVGMVQTRWGYLNRHDSVLTEVQAMLLDGHFVLEHGARFGENLFFNFNGTAGIWRRQAIEEAGGWEHDTMASLRLIPGLDVWRPADTCETAVAWTMACGPMNILCKRVLPAIAPTTSVGPRLQRQLMEPRRISQTPPACDTDAMWHDRARAPPPQAPQRIAPSRQSTSPPRSRPTMPSARDWR